MYSKGTHNTQDSLHLASIWETIKDFIPYLRPYWFSEVMFMVLASVSTGMSLLMPLFLKLFIDHVIPNRDVVLLYWIFFILILTTILSIGLEFLSSYLHTKVSNSIVADIREVVFNRVIHFSQTQIGQHKHADIMHRMMNECDAIKNFLTTSIIRTTNSLIVIIGVSTVLIWLNFQLFLIALSGYPAFFLAYKLYKKKIEKYTQKQRILKAGLLGFFTERTGNVKIVQIFDLYKREMARLRNLMDELIEVHLKRVKTSYASRSLTNFPIAVSTLLIFLIGGLDVINNVMSLGSLVAFMQYISRLKSPLSSLNDLYYEVIDTSVSMQRIKELSDMPQDDGISSGIKQKMHSIETIRFENVKFKYNKEPILNDITIELKKGRKYGIIGRSGSGKTTMINLLCRFYKPDEGSIIVNQNDLQSINIDTFRSKISIVTQENLLFDNNIYNNIKLGNLQSDESEVTRLIDALDLGNLMDINQAKANGLIGDEGNKLSEGQKKRVSIARALLKKADVLILDESISALESTNGRAIMDLITERFASKIVIMISHRLSDLKMVDEILCLDQGYIVEVGSHQSLMERRSFYWNHFREQFISEDEDKRLVTSL